MTASQNEPAFYISMPHPCSYLPGRMATMLFVSPQQVLDTRTFAELTRHGFRRSGDFVYRPHCQTCQACVPVRIPVSSFRANRSQRRAWRRNQDLTVCRCEAEFKQEHFELYLRYQSTRHPAGGMDEGDPERYVRFLTTRHCTTDFYELRLADQLLGVAVADILPDGLSAVYTFYDPAAATRSLGVFAILFEIEHARQLGLPWVYLGYWIAQCEKMSYKRNFGPLQIYQNGVWLDSPEAPQRLQPPA
jgi:arginyl-tRNA--protein-N-Asp/Glu arginylyltransferase